MGKYMKSSNNSPELLSPNQSPLSLSSAAAGVRTRARTQRLATSPPADTPEESGRSFLQLRNRRLEKFTPEIRRKKRKGLCNLPNPNPNLNSEEDGEGGQFEGEKAVVDKDGGQIQEKSKRVDLGIQASCEEDGLEEFKDTKIFAGRVKREATPCSMLKLPDAITTPRFITKTNVTAEDERARNLKRPCYPPQHELDAFFAAAEAELQEQFIEKYNFVPVTEKPLPGRYEWVKVDP